MKTKIIMTLLSCLSSFFLNAQSPKVLMVMSSADSLPLSNGKVYRETGVFLSEFYLAYKAILQMGYEIDLATPNGNAAFIDQESYKNTYWGKQSELIPEATRFVKESKSFNQPLVLKQALETAELYTGLVVPGGQGLMVDLIKDSTMVSMLKQFSKEGKPIGLICHAPALLLSMPKSENPFVGYTVNSVTGLEEFFIERFVMKGKPYKRKIAKQLNRMGMRHKKARPGGNFAVRDRELITSQNPFSNEAFNQLFLEALLEYKQFGNLKAIK